MNKLYETATLATLTAIFNGNVPAEDQVKKFKNKAVAADKLHAVLDAQRLVLRVDPDNASVFQVVDKPHRTRSTPLTRSTINVLKADGFGVRANTNIEVLLTVLTSMPAGSTVADFYRKVNTDDTMPDKATAKTITFATDRDIISVSPATDDDAPEADLAEAA